MEMEDLLISTGVDSFIRLIQEKKKVDLAMASKLLNLPQTTIEDWAHILEEEGIIRIDYQLTKVYFIWIIPTSEQVEKEKQIFKRKKIQVETEINKLDQIQETGKRELRQYTEAVENISKKFAADFAKIEALSAQIQSAKQQKQEVSKQSLEKMGSLHAKLSEIDGSIKGLELQLQKTGRSFEPTDIEPKLRSIDEAKEHIDELGKQLNELVARVEDVKAQAPREDVDVGDVKADVEGMREKFQEVHEDSEYLRSMISEFKANADTIQDAVTHIRELSASAEQARKKLRLEYEHIEALKVELPELEKQIVDDLAIADQYSETINIAQEVLENVPTKKEILDKLERLEMDEERMGKELHKLESALSGVSGNVLSVGELMEDLEDMKTEVEEARNQLSEEADEVLSSVEEETATYATFQKIKAKTKMAIDAYVVQLARIRQETAQIKEDIKTARKQSAENLDELATATTPESTRKAMELISQLQTKKEELQKIRGLIADLNARSGMIEKNIKLLSKEAKLIALRSSGTGGKETKKEASKTKKVKEKISLTAEEQEEFELKRKELKGLIRKLWETD